MLEWMHWRIETAIITGLMFLMFMILAIADSYRRSHPRKGFLPFLTTRGDRVFLSMIVMIVIGLVWLRFVPLSMWGAFLVSLVVAVIFLKYA